MNKIKKFISSYVLGIGIWGILLGGATVVIATITSTIVEYDNTNSGTSAVTVQTALDELYSLADNRFTSGTGTDMINVAKSSNLLLGLNPSIQGGMYRFQGRSGQVYNYICFGTKDKSTCTGTPGTYMYRIIGIKENGQMKLIKNEAMISDEMNSSSTCTWPNCSLYSKLNGSRFLTNTTYVPSGWSSYIADTTWHYGRISIGTGLSTDAFYAEEIYTREQSTTTNAGDVTAKIGLMYLSDWYLSIGDNVYITVFTWSNYSWLKGSDNLKNEWTMTSLTTGYFSYLEPSGCVSSSNDAYECSKVSSCDPAGSNHSNRPVFYLVSTATIASGTGTSTDPFILS